MDKVIRDGKVAVLVSPGFGAGWYTWNSSCEDMVFDRQLVEAVEKDDYAALISRANELCPDGYFGGADGLAVYWVPEGEAFEITEYDGSEHLVIIGQQTYLKA